MCAVCHHATENGNARARGPTADACDCNSSVFVLSQKNPTDLVVDDRTPSSLLGRCIRDEMAPVMWNACCCCYDACDCDNTIICCKGRTECLCLVREACLSLDEEPLGVGLVTNKANKECCKIGLYCCTCGIKTPETIHSSASQCLFFKSVCSCELREEYVKDFVCAWHGLQVSWLTGLCCPLSFL